MGDVIGELHPNDFYELIRPTMRLLRWPMDITLGELEEQGAKDAWLPAVKAVRELRLNLRNAETGETTELDIVRIEEKDGLLIIRCSLSYKFEEAPAPVWWPFK